MRQRFNNGKIEVDFPEDFALLDEEGRKAYVMQKKQGSHRRLWDVEAARSEERQITLGVGFLKRPLLYGRAASLESLRDSHMQATLKATDGGVLLAKTDHVIDGRPACGFRYRHVLKGKDLVSENVLVRTRDFNYMIPFSCRAEQVDQADAVFEEFLSSVKFS